ncbi:MAG: DUF1700 domain-containing protein [Eubacterium sp.]|nr:DUF1700 domain-containing protein [Eubacterium sp.]
MNKNTFLSELSRKLRRLPVEEQQNAINYYTEYFMDAGVGELDDVTPIVGSVDEVSARIIDECTEKQVEIVKSEGGIKNSTKAIWLVILGIFAAPIALPIAIAVVAVVFAILVSVIAVIAALIAASFGVLVAGVAAFPAIFWAETTSQAMVIIGIVCMCIALGVLFCIAFYQLGKLIVIGIIELFRSIGKNRKNKTKVEGGVSE